MDRIERLPDEICVLVCWTRFIGIAQRTYELCLSPKDRRELSPREAKALIEERGLVKALETKDGSVYDTPERAFFNKYKGWYKVYKQ